MFKKSLLLFAALTLSLSQLVSAALYDRGNGLIYDDVLDITWLQDANYAQKCKPSLSLSHQIKNMQRLTSRLQ